MTLRKNNSFAGDLHLFLISNLYLKIRSKWWMCYFGVSSRIYPDSSAQTTQASPWWLTTRVMSAKNTGST